MASEIAIPPRDESHPFAVALQEGSWNIADMGSGVFRRLRAMPAPVRGILVACWLFITLAAFVVILRWASMAGSASLRGTSVLDPMTWYQAVRTTSFELWLAFALCVVVAFATRRGRRGVVSVLTLVFAGLLALFILLLNLAAAATLPVFGTTPNIGMLLYSDLLFSRHGRTAIVSWVPPELWTAAAFSLFVSCAAALLLWRYASLRRPLVTAVAGAGICLTALAAKSVLEGEVARKSPTVVFAGSLQLLRENGLLGTGVAAEPVLPGPPVPAVPIDRDTASRIRNVLLVVLESVSAEYVDPYGGPYAATPSLVGLQGDAILFENAYSNAVSSVAAMSSLLSSRHPRVSVYQPVPSGPMLPELLERNGWRTALFHSSDNRYSSTSALLEASGFGLTRDFRGRHCPEGLIEDRSEFNSLATPDACTFEEMKRWIDADRDTPFFGMLWTFQTHYPYFPDSSVPRVTVAPGDLPEDPVRKAMKGAYLSALRSTDRQIGLLMAHLRETGLDRETLVIVVGDHGAAFGQHGTFGHGGDLFEENVRVPLVFIYPGLARERRAGRLASHVDLAPSIADLLGLETPSVWNGQSLFRPGLRRPVLFSTPWIDLVVGYRLEDRKVVARLVGNEVTAFDLARDPGERHDLLAGSPALRREEMARLRSWFRWTDRVEAEAGPNASPD